jgi:hypothetical protein
LARPKTPTSSCVRRPTGSRLVSDKGGIKVVSFDALAEALSLNKAAVIGQRVTVWGRIKDEEFTPKGAKRPVRYQVLTLERIKAPTFEMPYPEAPGQETLPLTDDEKAAISGGLE